MGIVMELTPEETRLRSSYDYKRKNKQKHLITEDERNANKKACKIYKIKNGLTKGLKFLDAPESIKKLKNSYYYKLRSDKQHKITNFEREAKCQYEELYRIEKPQIHIYHRLKKRAKKKGIDFNLTKDYIKTLLKNRDKCPLLGLSLDCDYSFDRFDNTKGYIVNNVWLISTRANTLKNDLLFLEAKAILLNYKLEHNLGNPIILRDFTDYYKNKKYSAKKHGVEFNVNLEEIQNVAYKYCPYLGIELDYSSNSNNKPHKAQLDRINPCLGYVKGNIIFCSKKANQSKSNSTYEEYWQLIENWSSYIKEKQ